MENPSANLVPRQPAEIIAIKDAIEQEHRCLSHYNRTVAVREPEWNGFVRIFDLTDHPKATCCFVWPSEKSATGFQAVLNIAPIDSPESAVRSCLAHGKT